MKMVKLIRQHWAPTVVVCLLAAHFCWLCQHVAPAYVSPDADGYFAQARLIATEGTVTFRPESPAQYVGLHWLQVEDGRFISRYPPGLPVLLAGPWRLFGREAAFYVNPLLATLTLLFLFLLCRPWVGEKLALVAVLIFAVNPLANYHAVHSDAHTASTFFLVAGLWLLDSWIRNGSGWRALGAGLLLGFLPAVRYAEAAAAIGIAILVAYYLPKLAGRRKELLILVAGAALPLGLLLLHHHIHFGAFWKTGYALTNEQQIRWEYFEQHWRSYLDALMSAGVGSFVALGFAGLAGMLIRSATRGLSLGLLFVNLSISVVYASYYFNLGPGGASLRFLLPTLPLYLLPAMWLFRQLSAPRIAGVALAVLVAVYLVQSVPASAERMGAEHRGANRAAVTLAGIKQNVPEGSVIIAGRWLHEQIHSAGKWKLADSSALLGGLAGFEREGFFGTGSDRPTPLQAGKTDALRSKYSDLPPAQRCLAAVDDLRQWAGAKADVYWIGSRDEIERFDGLAAGTAQFEETGEIAIPAPEEGDPLALALWPGAAMGMRELMRQRPGGLGGPRPGGRPGMGNLEGMLPPPGRGGPPGPGSEPGSMDTREFMRRLMAGGMGAPAGERIEVYRLKR